MAKPRFGFVHLFPGFRREGGSNWILPSRRACAAYEKTKALTQSELARRSHLALRTLAYWETGQKQPRIPELQAALTALAATPEEVAQLLHLLDTPRSLRLAEETLQASVGDRFAGAGIGDLLRAMRMRRGMTQAEVADRLRINRQSVLRWETMRRFPSEKSLARLCLLLNAYPEEEAALRRRLLIAPEAASLSSLEDCEEAVKRFAHQVFHMETPLIDLNALILKRRLHQFAAQSEEALRLKAIVELEHSSWLYYQERPDESREAVWRCLNGVRGRFAPERFWASALSLASVQMSLAVKGNRAGFRLLQEWLPLMPNNTLRALLLCDMAHRMNSDNNREETNALLNEARHLSDLAGTPYSLNFYKMTNALIRMQTEGSVESLEWLLELANSPDQRLAYIFMWINALLASGDKQAALPFMTQAQTEIHTAVTPKIQSQFAALSRRF